MGLANEEHASRARFGHGPGTVWDPARCSAANAWSPRHRRRASQRSDSPDEIDGGGANNAPARDGRTAPRAASSEASPSSPAARRLVLYTKPGCCLCDGVKEKLHATFLLAGTPYSLASLELQEGDITTNPEWEQMYRYEIPVLAKLLPDCSEEKLPRLSPRLSVELVQKKVFAAFDK